MDERNDILRYLWSRLSSSTLAQYARHWAALRFIECGLEVYSAGVDDRAIDCLVRYAPGRCLEVNVKAVRNRTRAYIEKEHLGSSPERVEKRLRQGYCVAFFMFEDGREPDMFLVPGYAWLEPNPCIVDNTDSDDDVGPRFEINPSENYQATLDKYRFERQLLAGIIRKAQGI